MQNFFVGVGENIEKTEDVPLIGKLTNLLPFAMIAACCKECPGQTMVMLIGLLFCGLSQNESIRSTLLQYNIIWGHNQTNSNQTNDTASTPTSDNGYSSVEKSEEENITSHETIVDEEYNGFKNTEYLRQQKNTFL